MSTKYRVRFASKEDILFTRQQKFIYRCNIEPYVSLYLTDGKEYVLLTYFMRSCTLSFIKSAELDRGFALYVARTCRNVLEEFNEKVYAWVSKKDLRANKFIQFLGFSPVFEKKGYYKYIWQ
jgi:hypothetical protein